MLPISTPDANLSRRQLLQAAGASAAGSLWTSSAWGAARESSGPRSCIFIWLNGGPSQFETFDPKPWASADVRGPFGVVRTPVPGVVFSELIPNLARQFDKFAVVRSLVHGNTDHSSTAMLTGIEGGDIPYGAVVAKLLGPAGPMPSYIHVGSSKGDGTQFVTAVDQLHAGALGATYAPLRVLSPVGSGVQLGDFSLDDSVSPDRFRERRELLQTLQVGPSLEQTGAGRQMADLRARADEILSSPRVRDTFDLTREPESLRYRYGANHFGQSCLLARRLVEAGTRYVQVKWYHVSAFDAWDTHGADLPGMRRLEQQLCPRLDLGLAALLEDLHERGLLDTTLVVVVGEFGRTPSLNKNGDRDHWPYCFSALFAGAGIEGGTIVGASDSKGAYPTGDAYSPGDFAATIYKLLGFDVAGDLRIRPFLANGLPIRPLTGEA
jgi:hypothetical protein